MRTRPSTNDDEEEVISPDAHLRQCIISNVKGVTGLEMDDILILIGDVKADDLYAIEKFAGTDELVRQEWSEILQSYSAWLDTDWDKEMHPNFALNGDMDVRIAAMNRLIDLNALRRNELARSEGSRSRPPRRRRDGTMSA